jgi:hypothetical protein
VGLVEIEQLLDFAAQSFVAGTGLIQIGRAVRGRKLTDCLENVFDRLSYVGCHQGFMWATALS